MRKMILIVALSAVFISGCSDPKIDVTTEDALKSSVTKVRESLPQEKRLEFDESLQILAFSQVDMQDVLAAGANGGSILQPKIMRVLDGKTADEVISEAEKIRIERQEKEKEQAISEIRELEKKLAESLQSQDELKKIEVLRSRFYVDKGQFRSEPIIELTVKNGSMVPISRIYFDSALTSPGRSVPWVKDDFNYSISGGLEPDEEQTWRLAPNMFSEWGKREYPSDAVLTVTVTRADDADGKAIANATEFGERERKRLTELKDKYGE